MLSSFKFGLDTPGQIEHEPLTKETCRKADILVVGFSVTSRCSFDETNGYIDWVKDSTKLRGIIAVGNKIDLESERQVPTEEAEEHFQSMTPPIPYIETSVKTGANVKKVFELALELWLHGESYERSHPNDNEKTGQKDPKHCIIN